MKTLIPALCAFIGLLSGCATAEPPVSSWPVSQVESRTTITRDDFKKITVVSSPSVLFAGDGFVDIYRFGISAVRKDGESAPTYYITLGTQRGYSQSWAFWRSAADRDGVEFKFETEATNVIDGGIVTEKTEAVVDRVYLNKLASAGTRWRIYGDHAEKEFDIGQSLVAGFLSRCDAAMKPL